MEIYNLGTDEKVKIIDLARLILKKMGKKLRIKKTNMFHGNTSIRCPNIKKIKKLGFRQKVKLNRGIDLIVKNQKRKIKKVQFKWTKQLLRNYLKEAAILPPSTVSTAPVVFFEIAKWKKALATSSAFTSSNSKFPFM